MDTSGAKLLSAKEAKQLAGRYGVSRPEVVAALVRTWIEAVRKEAAKGKMECSAMDRDRLRTTVTPREEELARSELETMGYALRRAHDGPAEYVWVCSWLEA